MAWTVELLDERVEAELAAFPADLRARFLRVADLLERFGPMAVSMPHVRSLGDGLWEMRLAGKDNIGRALYVVARGSRLVVVHAFVKKTRKTPKRALEVARQRAKEVV